MNHIKDHLNQVNIVRLKTQLALAREKLQQAWDSQGKTDSSVITAGEEFDALLNQYQRMKQSI